MSVGRDKKLLAGLAVFMLLLIVKLFQIQIVDDSYKTSSDNQSMVYNTIYPTRGIIYDRNGEILVANRMAYDIMVTPRKLYKMEFDTVGLANALNVDVEFIRNKFKYYAKYRTRIGWQPQVFLKHVDPEIYMRFAEIQYRFPGFEGVIRNLRHYPINSGGNLLGYCSEVDDAYMAKHPGEYRSGDYAGRTGIEAAREKELRGQKGYKIYLRGSNNQIKDHYKNGEMDLPAVAGKDITTTIDAGLQIYGQQLMKNKVGALVAIEPKTGEILALISSPCIDVEWLADFGSHYEEILANKYRPMFNRAVASSYPPGSVFKLLNCLIGLQENVLTPDTYYPCQGGYFYNNKKLGCHHHASPLNMEQSIMMSCNGYYCYVLKSILSNPKYKSTAEAFDKWREYVTSFGFGQKLGSDFPSELAGNIPTSAHYDKVYRKRWNYNTVISLSIGQGEIGCTPLHIANFAATIANRGYYIVPHIIKAGHGVEIDPKYYEKHYTMVDTTNFNKIIGGMYKAVNAGPGSGATAWIGAVPGLDICGKTGTAQNPRGDDNSVFICFAPKDDPKIAVAVYVENGGFGATWAVPMASLLVEKYLCGEVSRPDLEKKIFDGNLMYKVKPYR